jgi:hypothetical protein
MPNWTPESNFDLVAPAVSVDYLEENAMRLWHEFLRGWFNGASHVIGLDDAGAETSRTFPLAADLKFQQMKLKQPLAGLGIQVLQISAGNTRRMRMPGTGLLGCYNQTLWRFQLRAALKNDSGGRTGIYLVRQAADLLYNLLVLDRLTAPLHAKGIHHIDPQPPVLIANAMYAMRAINCRATLIFPADYGNVTAVDYGVFADADGNYYKVEITVQDGIPLIGQPELVVAAGAGNPPTLRAPVFRDADGNAYSVPILVQDGVPTLGQPERIDA